VLAGNFLWFREPALDVVPVQPSVGAQRIGLGEPLVALPLLGAIGQVPPLAFGPGFGIEGLAIYILRQVPRYLEPATLYEASQRSSLRRRFSRLG
jgi:hypothetical protein